MNPDRGLPPFPDGWYAVAFSDELAKDAVLARRLADRELVVYRAETGEAVVMDAHCPHLGAHLGLGGTVAGTCIRCPFHGFEYDATGACVATGYGTDVPAGLATNVWRHHETDGVVLVWYHGSGGQPTFAVPDLSVDGWTDLRHATFELRDHPQETTENAVDLGHFAWVHGYQNVELEASSFADGPMFRTKYTARRPVRALGPILFEFEPEIWGLGYSMVRVTIPERDIDARLLVLATPVGDDRIELRLASRVSTALDRAKVHPLAQLLPAAQVARLANHFLLRAFASDAAADFTIWENKRYVERPRLARGDGPIGQYRKWAKQFYSDGTSSGEG